MNVVSYARASPGSPDPQAQLDSIKAWAVANGHVVVGEFADDQVSGTTFDRPALARAEAALEAADAIAVTKIDRMGRTLMGLEKWVKALKARGKGFIAFASGYDTTANAGSVGTLMFQMLGMFAEYEYNSIRERTEAGKARARAKGVKFGRKPKVIDMEIVHSLRNSGKSFAVIAAKFGVAASTIQRTLEREEKLKGIGR